VQNPFLEIPTVVEAGKRGTGAERSFFGGPRIERQASGCQGCNATVSRAPRFAAHGLSTKPVHPIGCPPAHRPCNFLMSPRFFPESRNDRPDSSDGISWEGLGYPFRRGPSCLAQGRIIGGHLREVISLSTCSPTQARPHPSADSLRHKSRSGSGGPRTAEARTGRRGERPENAGSVQKSRLPPTDSPTLSTTNVC